MTTENSYRAFAERLRRAERERAEVGQLTVEEPGLTVEDGYRIQDELVRLREAEGRWVIGLKMGLTSRVKQRAMGVGVPIYGRVFDDMRVEDGATISLLELIHPRVEAELAFVLARALRGPDVSADEVLAATQHVIPVLEVIDSRYRDFKFALPDVIADNTSAARVVLGGWRLAPGDIDLRLTGVVLEKNREVVSTGAAAAVLGNPLNSIALLARLLASRGQSVPTGFFILAGAITEATPVGSGDVVRGSFDRLGVVTVRFV